MARLSSAGGSDRTVCVWSFDGTLLCTLDGHTGSVWSVAFSPDGKTIISGSEDKTVRVWSFDGILLRTLEGHRGSVWSVAFSPDGKTIISGSEDKTVRAWELSSGREIYTLLGHTGTIYSVAFSPDGQLLVSGSKDKTIRLWSRGGSSVGEPLQGHEEGVNSVAFSPDGRMLVSCSGDRSIKLWRSQEAEVADAEPETTDQSLLAELKAVLAITDEQERAKALVLLMARSPEDSSSLLRGLSTIENEGERVSALIVLIPHLPSTLLSNALDIVGTIHNVSSRFQGLATLAALLPEVVPEALQAGLEIEDESTRLRALKSVVEKLPSEFLPQALSAALTIKDAFSRARALIALVNKLPEATPQSLEATLEIEDEYSRACALRELVPHLSSSLIPKALEVAFAIRQEAIRNDLLKDLIPFLPENLLQRIQQRISLATETPRRTSLLQKENTQIYTLCTSTPWNLPLDALVVPVGYRGGLGNLAAAFQEFLGMSSKWLSQAISEAMRASKLKHIKPEQPLLVQLSSEINAQISLLTGSTSERFLICATSESEDELSSTNTSIAYQSVVRLAVDRRFRRLIVPLIGTGANQLPVDEVATGMLSAINNVLKSLKSTSLEEITIVDRDEDKIATITSSYTVLVNQVFEQPETQTLHEKNERSDLFSKLRKNPITFSRPELQTILFLAANPKDTGRLRVDQELRDINEGLKRAQKRDQFKLEQRLAVRPRDIQRAMLDVNPQIIHFSGYGKGEAGLIFEDDIGNTKLVGGAALAGLFELFAEQIHCVVLNGCYSEVQAKAIAQHIPFVIGMNQGIGDKAAIAFAVGFYEALGAGRPIEFAYKLGCSAIRMEGIAEHLTPVLLKQSPNEEAMIQPNPDLISSAPAPQPADAPIEVFISFSHKDDDLREELVTHLSNLRRQGKISAWHDRAIEAGEEWEAQIKDKLESARIILLLISASFMASDYCYDIEMERAIARHDAGSARVIPILLRPCDWKGSPFSKLKILPKDGKPVTQWSDRDTAFVNVVQGLRRAVDSLSKK